MPRHAIPAVLLVLVLVGVVTAFEVPLFQGLRVGSRPNQSDFIAINFFTSAVMLAFVSVVRLNGYTWAPLHQSALETKRP